ncbi:MAG: aminoglycoside phosphotransferase family protein [Bacteroidota bacterium]
MQTPAAEIELTPSLIEELLTQQAPEFAQLPLSYLSEGWDNTIFRLGDEFLLRMPRREVAVSLIRHEQRWLPKLAKALPIAVPTPVFAGQPQGKFPWPWSIIPWFKGQPAAETTLADEEAERLASFYQYLHQLAPADAPVNPSRGGPLSSKAAATTERLTRLQQQGLLDARIQNIWEDALAAPTYEDAPRWLHGDSHPKNMLVYAGRFSAIIDWGDITAGDVANDLAAFWMLFDRHEVRQRALLQYGADVATIRRARGWAVFFGAILLEIGLQTPDLVFEQVGRFTLNNLYNSA